MVTQVTSETFAELVTKAEGLVLVDFSATWCGPCRMVAPLLEEIAAEHGDKVAVYKLDIDESRDVALRYGVMSVPTMILFQDGNPVRQTVGAQPKESILEFLGL